MMKASVVSKKRKSEIFNDTSIGHPTKKWYHTEENKGAPVQRERKKSLIGGLGGFLRKMKSTSALKEKNRSSDAGSALANATVVIASETSDTSCMSESSQEYELPPQFVQNAHLRQFVSNVAREPSDIISTDQFSDSSFSDSASLRISGLNSLCTPVRSVDFERGQDRGSSRSMPGSSIVNGLCNSVQRTSSSVSNTDMPRDFLRRKSLRLMKGSSLSKEDNAGSVIFAPLAEVDETLESPAHLIDEAITPVSRNESQSTWVQRSTSRILGRNRASLTSTPQTPLSALERSVLVDNSTPIGTSSLHRASQSGSSIQKMLSSAIKKVVRRGSNTGSNGSNENVDVLPAKLKRVKTQKSRERNELRLRRVSDVAGSAVIRFHMARDNRRNTVELEKSKKAQEARLFLKQVRIAEKPFAEVYQAEGHNYQAVLVDVFEFGVPASISSKYVLQGTLQTELRENFSNNNGQPAMMARSVGPSIIPVLLEARQFPEYALDRRIRTGVGMSLREAFHNKKKTLLSYPAFCKQDELCDVKLCVDQYLQMTLTALSWNGTPDEFEYVTLCGINAEQASLLKERYDHFVKETVNTLIAQAEDSEVAADVESLAGDVDPSSSCSLMDTTGPGVLPSSSNSLMDMTGESLV